MVPLQSIPKYFPLLKRAFSSASSSKQVQEDYMSEPCIQVDTNDQPIGPISKKDCHSKSILHRVFSVFLFIPSDPQQRLLLQKRSADKILFPSVWSSSCCSHPLYNPSEMDTREDVGVKRAALRKLDNELNISSVELADLHMVGKFTYQFKSDAEWSEHEIDYALIVSNFTGSLSPNPEEVSEVRFVDATELECMFESSSVQFSPWFQGFHKFKWLKRWWENLDQIKKLDIRSGISQID